MACETMDVTRIWKFLHIAFMFVAVSIDGLAWLAIIYVMVAKPFS